VVEVRRSGGRWVEWRRKREEVGGGGDELELEVNSNKTWRYGSE